MATVLFDEVESLRQAKRDMGHFEEWADASLTVPAPEMLLASAQAYAAIAQAEATQAQTEQLRRIADALSSMDANANSIAKAIYSNNPYN